MIVMQIKKHIPNIITLLNLFCGCIALIFVTKNDFLFAFLFVGLGIFLDFFDGFFARLFRVSSPLGLQLDSLADMVTSGVVPGFIMFKLLGGAHSGAAQIIPYLGFLITLGACYRLANFNIDSRQTDSFIGLPTPANTLFIMSLPLILADDCHSFIRALLENHWFLLLITLLSALIMNAEIALFSLKVKKLNLKDNLLQIGFLTLSLILIFVFHFLGMALVILFYILLSVSRQLLYENKK
jgi:CDP-diacylglycerol--serine O-phosphatidyltransferase